MSSLTTTTKSGDRVMEDVHVRKSNGDSVDSFGVDDQYPTGTGSNGSVTLTNADTAYPVPTTAPTGKYVLTLYNGSDTDMYWGFENSNTNGMLLETGEKVAIDLGASQSVYCYCGVAGKVITYSFKKIE